MKRDMDLIRAILLAVEASDSGFAPRDIAVEGHSQDEIGYHCYLIGEADLAHVIDTTHMRSESPSAKIGKLTWQGHEFLDAARDDTVWSRTKERLRAAGKAISTVPISVLTALLIDETKRRLGLSP